MYDFHISDVATGIFPKSKFYWQNVLTHSCIVVEDSDSLDESAEGRITIRFVQGEPGSKVVAVPYDFDTYNLLLAEDFKIESKGKIFVKSVTFNKVEGRIQRNGFADSKIMNSIFELLEAKSWAFPRRIPSSFYIPESQCRANEQFLKNLVYGDNDVRNSFILAIDKAGVLLAKRMGIQLHGIITIKHYDTGRNEQTDSMADSINLQLIDGITPEDLEKRLVIVIDDLISSGITATRVVDYLKQLKPLYISFYSLYRTLASQEVPVQNTADVEYHSCFPVSNCYWLYGRGFDLSYEESRSLSDIYGAQKCWDWESEEDIRTILDLFHSPFRYDDYVDLALKGE